MHKKKVFLSPSSFVKLTASDFWFSLGEFSSSSTTISGEWNFSLGR